MLSSSSQCYHSASFSAVRLHPCRVDQAFWARTMPRPHGLTTGSSQGGPTCGVSELWSHGQYTQLPGFVKGWLAVEEVLNVNWDGRSGESPQRGEGTRLMTDRGGAVGASDPAKARERAQRRLAKVPWFSKRGGWVPPPEKSRAPRSERSASRPLRAAVRAAADSAYRLARWVSAYSPSTPLATMPRSIQNMPLPV